MTELYIVRHGQTDSNLKNAYLGRTDTELNATGISQSEQLAEALRNINFTAFYTSPLSRAVKTAEIIAKPHGKPVMTMSYGLIERDFGIWDNLTYDEIIRKNPDEYNRWLENWVDFRVPDGESARDVHERAANAVNKIIENNPDGRVLIVSHLGVIRHLIAYLLGMEIDDAWKFTADNCSVTSIRIENGKTLVTGLNNRLNL